MSQPLEIVLEGTVRAEQVWTYLHIPFDVPENIARLDVHYEYSDAIGSDPHLTDGNTIDIGVFDTRGVDFNTEGFRGWSGSARSELFIASDEATSGYMPGPIQVGTWFICLGLYKIQPSGCDYQVTIKLTPTQTDASHIEFPKLLPLRTEEVAVANELAGWYRGEIHCHTVNSDGDSTVEAVVRRAEELGLDFLAITDHNNLTHQIDMNMVDTSLLLIPGVEVTNYHGHWNVWGDHGWIDFRITSEDDMRRSMAEAITRGYLVSCNHPRPYGPDWNFPAVDDFHCIEIWNGPWESSNDICLEFWEKYLREGKHYSAVGGSDSHFLKRDHHAKLGYPTNYVFCEGKPSSAKLLQSLRAGHTFISASPDGAQLYLEIDGAIVGDTVNIQQLVPVSVFIKTMNAKDAILQLIGAQGIIDEFAITTDNWKYDCQITLKDTLYIRAQIKENTSMLAVTNAIYFNLDS